MARNCRIWAFTEFANIQAAGQCWHRLHPRQSLRMFRTRTTHMRKSNEHTPVRPRSLH